MISSKKISCYTILSLISIAIPGCTTSNSSSTLFSTQMQTQNPDFSKPQRFLFSSEPHQHKYDIELTATSIYNDTLGYGFDLSTSINTGKKPYYFSMKVPEGNYKITLELGHPTLASSTTVKAESRRLYLNNITTRAGQYSTQSFVVNVRNSTLQKSDNQHVALKEREKSVLHWDNKLTLEIIGDNPQVRSLKIEPIKVSTIFLAGDSTVTDQPYEPAASWGQMLTYFFNDKVAIANYAESGETMKAFIGELRFEKIEENLKKGDYLFIQFGHNDQKKQWESTYLEANSGYKEYLQKFIQLAKSKGATPVLLTSMQRRTFDKNGKITNSHGDYPKAVRELAAAENIALIDLDSMSVAFYEALGVNKAPLAFNDNGKDATHHNNYGAYELARCVVQGIRNAKLPLANSLKNDIGNFDPSHPDDVDSFAITPSPARSQVRPDGN